MENKNLAEKLSSIIDTPVSTDILDNITEKQSQLLKMMIENITKPNSWAFYYKNEEDSRKVIYSILDYGRSKLKQKEYSDKTKFYLNNKLK